MNKQKVPSALSASMKEADDKIKEVGDKTTEFGKGLSTIVTAPIVAIGVASLSAFNEVDKGMDIITQKTGAFNRALKEMQDSIINLATSLLTDFETAGAALTKSLSNTTAKGKSMKEFLKDIQVTKGI